MSFDRGAPAFWFVEIFLDGETLRHCNANEAITFAGATYAPLGDRLTPPRDIDRAANLKAQKFSLTYDSSQQTVDTDPIGIVLDAQWKRRKIRVRYAVGDVGAAGYDFSDPFIIADETGRIKSLSDSIAAGSSPALDMEVESGALIFLERRNQTRSPANQRKAFAGDAFFDLAQRLDGVVLPWRTKRARNGKVQITYEVDGVAPRQMLIGRGITRGSFVYGCTVGQQRKYWNQIYALADHQCEALEALYINGVDVLIGESALVHGTKKALSAFASGGTRLWVTWYDGRSDQTADAYLISQTSGQALPWTSAHRGRGVSYVIIEHLWDSDNPESFAYEFQLKGARVYQEQKDTTAGGSGSHRLATPSTWEYTTNPEEALRHYLRGRVVGPDTSYCWFGVGADTDFLDPYALYLDRADHCDEAVALQAGGTQTRYEANGWISAADSHAKNIQKLADCMVADPVDEGGRVSIRLSEPQTPVIALYDTDLVSDEETVIDANARGDDVINRVEGRFQDPANKYSSVDYPPVSSATFEEIDGDEIEGTWNQDLETSEERAQRKATLYLNKQRRTVELEEHFGTKAKDVRPGDWITRHSSLRGFPSGKTFIADEVRRFVDGTVRLVLLEVDPNEIVWDELDAQLTDIGDGPEDPENEALSVPVIAVAAISVAAGDVTLPAIRFTITDYADAMGDEVIVEFGIWNGLSGGSAGIAGPSSFAKIPGHVATFDGLVGLLPGTGYAFRFQARDGERYSSWSAFGTLTTTGTYQAGASAIADSIVGQGWGATASEDEASNAYVPRGTNLAVNGTFADGATGWDTGAGAVVTDGANAYVGDKYYLTDGIDGTRRSVNVSSFLVAPGEYLQIGAVAKRITAGSAGLLQVNVRFFDASGTIVGTVATGPTWTTEASHTAKSVILTVPATSVRAETDIRPASVSGGRAWAVGLVFVERLTVAGSNLISSAGVVLGDAAIITASGTAAGIAGQGWGATASITDAGNAYVPNGVNQLVDHDFRFAATYWRATAATGSVSYADATTLGIRRRTLTGSGVTVGSYIQLDTYPDRTRFACKAGDLVEASAYVSTTNCTDARVFIRFFNAAGSSLGFSAVIGFTPGTSTAELSSFVRGSVLAVAPASTAYALMAVRGTASAAAPVMHVAKPMFAIANSSQTVPSAWNPGLDNQPGADVTASGTAAGIAGQGSLATNSLARGTTGARPAATGSGNLYVNTTTGTVQLDTSSGVWTDIATLSTAVQTRGKIISGATSFSANSTWQVMAQVDVADVPSGGVIQAVYVDVVGQSQSGAVIGAGYQWRLCEAPVSSPSTKTVIRSGNIAITGGAHLGGGVYEPPTVDSVDQPSAALVAVTNTGNVRYTIEIQKTSGSVTIGLLATANFIINPG